MADTREITITIKNDTAPNAQPSPSPNPTTQGGQYQSAGGAETQASGDAVSYYTMIANQAFRQAAANAVAAADYLFERHFMLTDNYKGAEGYNNAKRMISWGVQSAFTIIGRTLQGAKYGPVGAVVGFAVGTIEVGANAIISQWKAIDEQNIAIAQASEQVNFGRQMVGWSLSGGSIAGANL